jgi:hypothetical protein
MPPKRKRKRKQADPHDELGVKVDRTRITKRSAADLLKHNPIKARALTKSRLMANMNKRQAQLDAEAIQASKTPEHKARMTAAEKRNKIQLYADQAALNVRTLSASDDPRHRAIAAEAMQALQRIDIAKNIGLQAAKTAAARTGKVLTPKPPPGPPPTSPARVVQGKFYPEAKAAPKTPTAPKTPKAAPTAPKLPQKAATRAKPDESPQPKGKRLDLRDNTVQQAAQQVVVDARKDARAAQQAATDAKLKKIRRPKQTLQQKAILEIEELYEAANEHAYPDLVELAGKAYEKYRDEKALGEPSELTKRNLLKAAELKALHDDHGDKRPVFEKLNALYNDAVKDGLDMTDKFVTLGNAQNPTNVGLAAGPELGNQPPGVQPILDLNRPKPPRPPLILPFAGDQP